MSEHQPPAWPSYFTDLNFMVSSGFSTESGFRVEGLQRQLGCTLHGSCARVLLVGGASAAPVAHLCELSKSRCAAAPQVLLMPAGIIACFRPLTDASLFLVLYGAAAVYFSGVMVSHVSYCITFIGYG